MLRLALLFFVIAIILAVLGFGGISGMTWDIGRYLFIAFLILAILSLFGGVFRRPPV